MKTIRLFIIAIMLFPAAIYSQTVYVNSSTGNDATGDGSAGNPYKTFHKGYTMTSSGGTLDLTGTFTWTDADETGDAAIDGYKIQKDITIQGQGAGVTIIQAASTEGTANSRIFYLYDYYININDVTLRYGNLSNATTWQYGACLYLGSLTKEININNCNIEYNHYVADNTSTQWRGGGAFAVYNTNTTTVSNINFNNCDINNNTTNTNGIFYSYFGTGGKCLITLNGTTVHNNDATSKSLFFAYYASYSFINSTITSNTCRNVIYNIFFGDLYLTNTTVAYNTLNSTYEKAVSISSGSGNYGFKNSIIAQNRGTDNVLRDYSRSGGTVVSNSNNIVEAPSSDFTNGVNGNITGEQSCLGLSSTLNYGSQTPTLPLEGHSVAINAGTTSANGGISIPAVDQRGVSRVGATDIGAYEFTGTILTPELTVSETSLSGFAYIQGAGPSSSQSFTVSGQDLASDVTVTASVNYEVSDGGAFGASVVLTPTGSTLSATTVYVRLKSGLTAGARNGTLTVSTACDQETITLTGSVAAAASGTHTWNGSTSSDWNTASNWSSSVVPTNLYNVIIPSGVANYPEITNSLGTPASCYSLTVNSDAQLTILANSGLSVNGNITNNGTIEINSSSAGEGSLIIGGTVSGSGTFNVQRYLSENQWHLVSSPITTGTAGVFQGIWLRPYLESTNTFGVYITPTETPMPTGQGFSVWANSNDTRTYTGTINSGNQGPFSASLTGSAGANTGWNLMGNPYTSAIDWDAASGWTKTNLANSVYVWNGTQYATYIGGVGANGGSRYIAPGQGFFVQATAAGASLSMNKNIQLHNGVSFKSNSEDPENTIRISVSSSGYSDEAVIVIRESNTYAFDPQTDAYKFYGSADAPQLVIKKDDNSELCIASLSSGTDLIDRSVLLYPATDGQLTLTWSHNINHDCPMLYDNFTQTFILPQTEYVFVANSSDLAERFVFKENVTSVDALSYSINVWENNNVLQIQNLTNNQISNVSVYNMQGQLVMEFSDNVKDLSNLSPAAYIVKAVAGNKSVVEKVIIK